MAITVEHPSGARLEFPDGTPPETISAAMAQVGGHQPKAKPGRVESFFRGVGDGATLNWGDNIGLLDGKKQHASREENPWTHFAGEVVGSMVPMVAAGPAGPVAVGANRLQRARAVAGNLMSPAQSHTLGGAVAQGAKVGAVQGGISGAGAADATPDSDGTWSDELTRRAGGAALGYELWKGRRR